MNYQILQQNIGIIARRMSFNMCLHEAECRMQVKRSMRGIKVAGVEKAYKDLFHDSPFGEIANNDTIAS